MRDVTFQRVFQNAIIKLIKSSSEIQSISFLSYTSSRKLLDASLVTTTVSFTIRSVLGTAVIRSILTGTAVTSILVDAGYNVSAGDPVLTDLSPTASPTKVQPNSSLIAAITVGVFGFILLVVSLVYYFQIRMKVCCYDPYTFHCYYILYTI